MYIYALGGGVKNVSNDHFKIILSINLLPYVFTLGENAASWVRGVLKHIITKPLGKICWVNLQATIELVNIQLGALNNCLELNLACRNFSNTGLTGSDLFNRILLPKALITLDLSNTSIVGSSLNWSFLQKQSQLEDL